jgi:hypothetical protein
VRVGSVDAVGIMQQRAEPGRRRCPDVVEDGVCDVADPRRSGQSERLQRGPEDRRIRRGDPDDVRVDHADHPRRTWGIRAGDAEVGEITLDLATGSGDDPDRDATLHQRGQRFGPTRQRAAPDVVAELSLELRYRAGRTARIRSPSSTTS